MGKIEELKAQVLEEIEALRGEFVDLSLRIHAHPEIGLEEVKASEWLTEYLEEGGFVVQRGLAGLPTAFKARYGKEAPAIAFLAEYDALPEIGHGCAHNIIAAAAVGAGMAVKKRVVDQLGGSILVIGTPAEENHGGKTIMVEKGAFDDVDVAMMVHPGCHDVAALGTLAVISLDVEFWGKAAHAASYPEEGVNALEALILAFNNINSLRQHVRSTSRIHGIITKGGDAANIVPAHTEASFLVRSDDMEYLEELKEKVLNCFNASALATGARLDYRWGEMFYALLRPNLTLANLFSRNMESLGRDVHVGGLQHQPFSTDMGNVSQKVPSIHPIVAIASPEVSWHTPQFAAAAISEAGHQGLLDSARALALTAVDLLVDPEKMDEIKEEFLQKR